MSEPSNPFSSLDLPNLPEGPAVITGEGKAPKSLWKLGKVNLQRETAHRGGKVVVVVKDFATHLPQSVIDSVAKRLRSACGCGGTVRDKRIELQGDNIAKIRSVLEAEGFQVGGVKQ
jgi:translation initiation factor 1